MTAACLARQGGCFVGVILRFKLLLLALLSGLLLSAAPARAHEISMAEMELRQVEANTFVWQWLAGNRTGENVLKPGWPEGCADDGAVLRCRNGLIGRLSMDGVGEAFSAVMVKVYWQDGPMRVYTLTAGQPSVQLFGSSEDRRGLGEIARAYTWLGLEHILAGIDHLAFVLALLFLVGFSRRLVWTISAFTLAHSLTLGLSAMGLLSLRPPPVEATIALSIMLVAGEALGREQTLSRRWPALVAFLFGLVHGLGFAGALREIGLPDNHLLAALLTFNLGVEVGQLLVVLLALGLVAGLRRWLPLERARRPVLYGIGGLAAFWTLQRLVTILA